MWDALRSRRAWTAMAASVDIAILVPVRLPSAAAVQECLARLIQQLNQDGAAKFQVVVGYDSDDAGLRGGQGPEDHGAGGGGGGAAVDSVSRNLRARFVGLRDVWVQLPATTPFAACAAWNTLAKAASRAGSNLFLLLGDDVQVVSDTWFQQIVDAFRRISRRRGTPFGVGCVGAVEHNSPGWPCFPVLHRWHLDTLGDLFPVAATVREARCGSGFYNQDADPFVWEGYRRLGLTDWTSTVVLHNVHGGVVGGLSDNVRPTRYQPVHVEWRLELLRSYLTRLHQALPPAAAGQQLQVTMDVVVPSYRVDVKRLRGILDLETSAHLGGQVRFVIVVDRPLAHVPAETRRALGEMERSRRDVRIRCNRSLRNGGASAARSSGARDCHSEWILFLDDDVVPDARLLDEYLKAIRKHGGDGKVRGFVGLSHLRFDLQQSTMAFHLAEISCFWHIADWVERPPWGVTANLVLRWWPGLQFDTRFPKSGGGEDIDICIAAHSPQGTLLAVADAKVVHPWWDKGARWSLWTRVFRWAYGDSMLLSKHPGYTFLGMPNVVELSVPLLLLMLLARSRLLPLFLVAFWMADYVTGCVYCHLGPTIRNFPAASRWLLLRATLESSTVRQASDLGRFCGFLRRGEMRNMLCRRFDWFLGTRPQAIREQRMRGLCSMVLAVGIVLAVVAWEPTVFFV